MMDSENDGDYNDSVDGEGIGVVVVMMVKMIYSVSDKVY